MEAKPAEYAQYFATQIVLAGGAVTEQYGYQRISTGITNLQREAWALSKVEVDISGISLAGNISNWSLKLHSSSQGMGAAADLTQNQMLWACGKVKDQLTAVGVIDAPRILVFDLAEPILMLPQTLFVGLFTSGANPQPTAQVSARFWYRALTLKEQDFWDLVQLQNPIIAE